MSGIRLLIGSAAADLKHASRRGSRCASCPCPTSTEPEPGRRGLARAVRGARAGGASVGAGARDPAGRATTRSGSASSPSTSRTRSASRASSSSSPGARARARSTTTGGSASSSTATSARSRRSCRRSTRTRRCRSSTRVWLVDADGQPSRRRTRSSRPRTSRRAAGGSTRPRPRASGSTRTTPSEHLAPLHAALGRGRQVRPDDLAVPRDARRDRPRARLGGRGGGLLPRRSRATQPPDFQVKGEHPLTEHYSMLGPEVRAGRTARRSAAGTSALIEQLLGFDAVVIAGQAKSHCVAWTIDDLLAGDDAHGSSRSASTCSRTAPRRSSSRASSTTPTRRTPRSSASPRPGCTSSARPSRSTSGRASASAIAEAVR